MPKRAAIELLSVEVSSIRIDVKEVVRGAYVAATRLREAGASAAEISHSFFLNASADELTGAAARLRSAAVHAAALAGELMASAGRLEQVASVYEAAGRPETDV